MLKELIWDAQIDGSESQKNTFLEPAPPVPAIDREIIESSGNKVSSMLAEKSVETPKDKIEKKSQNSKLKKKISENYIDDLDFDDGVGGDTDFGLDLYNDEY